MSALVPLTAGDTVVQRISSVALPSRGGRQYGYYVINREVSENKKHEFVQRIRHIIENIGALAIIQVANAASPIVIYPFLLAVSGPQAYSEIVLAEAISLFVLTFVIYSFDIDGVVETVNLKVGADSRKIAISFFEITITRILFYMLSTIIVGTAVTFARPELLNLVLQWSLISLAYAIQPNWLFQALERNRPLACCVVISRVGAVATVLITTSKTGTHAFVPGIIGLWYLAGATAAAWYAVSRFGLKFERLSLKRVLTRVFHGKEVFLSNTGVTLYRDINILLLGAFGVPNEGIATYSMAEKFVKAIQASIRPFNQFFFPRALALAKEKLRPDPALFFDILRITVPQIGVVTGIILALVGGYVVFGTIIPALQKIPHLDQIALMVCIMSVATLPGLANFMFGSAGLNALGARGYFLKIVVITGIASVVANSILIPIVGVEGSIVSFVLSEILLFALIARRYFVC